MLWNVGGMKFWSERPVQLCSCGLTHLFDSCCHGLVFFSDIFQGLGLNLRRFFPQPVFPLEELLSCCGIERAYKEIKVVFGQVSHLLFDRPRSGTCYVCSLAAKSIAQAKRFPNAGQPVFSWRLRTPPGTAPASDQRGRITHAPFALVISPSDPIMGAYLLFGDVKIWRN